MASERENFSISGPLHLTPVDWTNANHRRSVAASLVQGACILERDRQQNHHGPQALAPPWWDFFHFQLSSVFVDDTDSSIFGAIYQFKSQASYCNYSAHRAPKYVVAFRGTITKPDSMSQDIKLDLQLICETLHESSRFRLAMQAVQDMVAFAGAANVWLAEHSLGSGIAMLVGKNMAKMNCPIESYLFNPPLVSLPIERTKNPKLKQGILFASSVIKAGLAVAVRGQNRRPQEHPFASYAWIPYLFVSPADHICSEYISHFEQRKKMEEIGAGNIERIAMQHSMGSLFLGGMGKNSEPLHLLPSAHLTESESITRFQTSSWNSPMVETRLSLSIQAVPVQLLHGAVNVGLMTRGKEEK